MEENGCRSSQKPLHFAPARSPSIPSWQADIKPPSQKSSDDVELPGPDNTCSDKPEQVTGKLPGAVVRASRLIKKALQANTNLNTIANLDEAVKALRGSALHDIPTYAALPALIVHSRLA